MIENCIGFTGTKIGMTQEQKDSFKSYLHTTPAFEFHHGNCVGADADASNIAFNAGFDIIAHPGDSPRFYSNVPVQQEMLESKPNLSRNKDIVSACDVLVATPGGPEITRSGTWATIRYARKAHKPIVIIWPDGSITTE